MKKSLVTLSIVSMLILGIVGQALAADATKYKIFVGFINHFTKFVQWPEEKKMGDFVIGVIGDCPIATELQGMNGKMLGAQKIVIKTFANEDAMSSCHIVFVSEKFGKSLSAISEKAKINKTLVLSESNGAAKRGSDINFIEDAGSVKFEINSTTANNHGLKIASKLKELGKVIE